MRTFNKLKKASSTSWCCVLGEVSSGNRDSAYEAFLTWWANWNKLADLVSKGRIFTPAEKQKIYAPIGVEKAEIIFASLFSK